MAYNLNLTVKKICVIGAGQIGPDIALHFAKTLSSQGVNIINLDISDAALENAKNKSYKKIQKDVEKGILSVEESEKIKSLLTFSSDYENVRDSQIVVEAATEDENIKDKIFLQVEKLTDDTCIYLSNSSHMQPEVIFRNIKNKSRCLVAHYFFPADRNPVVELVPSDSSEKILVEDLLGFYKLIGKKPIVVKSSYGYAVDPIFEGLCQTAILCLEKNLGNEKEIDKVAMETLGLGVGPFTALNLTGGNPITAHGLDEMGKKLMPWFKAPEILKKNLANNDQWNIAAKGEEINIPEDRKEKIAQQFLGAYFALASYIMDLEIVTIDDLDFACKNSLVVNPPFTMMNNFGIEKALQVVDNFCNEHTDFKKPSTLKQAANNGGWDVFKKQVS